MDTARELEHAYDLMQAQRGLRQLAEHLMHCSHRTGDAQMCVHLDMTHSGIRISKEVSEDVATGLFAVADSLREVVKLRYGIEDDLEGILEKQEQRISQQQKEQLAFIQRLMGEDDGE
jgi:hypothetical protein